MLQRIHCRGRHLDFVTWWLEPVDRHSNGGRISHGARLNLDGWLEGSGKQMKLKLPILGLLMTLVVGVLAACGGDATATPTASAVMTPEQLSDAYIVAVNSGDLLAFNDIFADDYVRTRTPGDGGAAKATHTKNAAITRLAGVLGTNPTLTRTSITVDGDSATGTFKFSADNLKAIGVDEVSGTLHPRPGTGKWSL